MIRSIVAIIVLAAVVCFAWRAWAVRAAEAETQRQVAIERDHKSAQIQVFFAKHGAAKCSPLFLRTGDARKLVGTVVGVSHAIIRDYDYSHDNMPAWVEYDLPALRLSCTDDQLRSLFNGDPPRYFAPTAAFIARIDGVSRRIVKAIDYDGANDGRVAHIVDDSPKIILSGAVIEVLTTPTTGPVAP